MKRLLPYLLSVACGVGAAVPALPTTALADERVPVSPPPVVEVAILLDTSNSMDGLIDQARTRLWTIINTLALSRRDGRLPDLRVALFEYGNDGLAGGANGHIRLVVPLSTDLDKISAELFSLRTNGGSEFCGHVIRDAVQKLEWAPGDHYRAIFIAGNEPFTQGSVHYAEAIAAAKAKGIVVNTIHCGAEAQARAGMWQEAAELAGGKCMNIDQDAATLAIATPYDKRLEELAGSINFTYLAFGREGEKRKELQSAQDEAARAAAPGALAERAQSKGSGAYRNSGWDLVDAVADGSVDLAKLEDEELPEEMRGMTPEQRKAHVEKKAAERKAVREEIAKLSVEREKFIAAEKAKMAGSQAETFDTAVKAVLVEQLEAKGFEMESGK